MGALIRARLCELRQKGSLAPAAIAVVSAISFLPALLKMWQPPLGAQAQTQFLRQLGQALWMAWLLGAVATRWDAGRHIQVRAWALQLGFRASHWVATLLAPTSAVVLAGYGVVLVEICLTLRLGVAAAAAAAVGLALFITLTLRITHLLLVFTRPGSAPGARVGALTTCLALVAWCGLARGIPPMHWVAPRTVADAARDLGGLFALLVAITLLDERVTSRSLFAGALGRRAAAPSTWLFRADAGRTGAMSMAAMLGWLRRSNVDFAVAFGALWTPAWLLVVGGRLQTGMPIAFCGFALLFVSMVRGNLLGIDGAGCWRFLAAGIRPSEVLVGRGRLLNLIEAAALIPTAAITLARGTGGLTSFVALAGFATATITLRDAAGLLLSRAFAEPAVRADFHSGTNAAGGNWVMAGTMAWTVVYLLGFLQISPGAKSWVLPIAAVLASLAIRAATIRYVQRSAVAWDQQLLVRLGAI